MYFVRNVIVVLLILCNHDILYAQSKPDTVRHLPDMMNATGHPYIIKGKVRDIKTHEGVSFSTAFFPKTAIGTTADLEGDFVLQTDRLPGDTLVITAVGYQPYKILLGKDQRRYELTINLEKTENALNEVTVHAGEDPALQLLKKIVSRRPYNNPSRLLNYKYRAYNKLELDLQHLSRQQFEHLPLLKHYSFIYDNQDTDAAGKPFLPIFLTETLSDYYYQSNPKRQREHIIANKIKGIKNDDVTRFLGNTYLEANVYNDYMLILGRQFVSPISNVGTLYYKYKIKDTEEVYGHRVIMMTFTPKHEGDACFYGNMGVVDSVYALQCVSLSMPGDANIDWVNSLSIYQEYAPVKNLVWFMVKNKFVLDAAGPYGLKIPSFIGRKTTIYKDILVDDKAVYDSLYKPEWKTDVIVDDSARQISDEDWERLRPDSLSKNEKAVYHMIDTLNDNPRIVFYKNTAKFLVTGKVDMGMLQFGPYWQVFSYNPIEGNRIKLPLGTSEKFSKNVHLTTYLAYGDYDKQFKYGFSGIWLLSHKPRMYVSGSYTNDVDNHSHYYDMTNTENVASSWFRKPGIPWKLAFVKQARIEFFKEYFNGFSHKLTFARSDYKPYSPLPDIGIFTDNEGRKTDHLINTEGGITFRYAYKERYIDGNYKRISLGSRYPIAELQISAGIRGMLNGAYNYQKVTFSLSNKLKIAPLGLLSYDLYAGKYFGTLPYPLLEIHPGNEQYYYNPHAFELMDRYEYLSSRYAGFNVEHVIGGGIFSLIPYVNKLKLRQLWTIKAITGDLSDADKLLNLNKGYPFQTLQQHTYMELGTGVENILELLRVDFVWRVLSPPGIPAYDRSHFGIFGSVRFVF